MTAPLAHTAFGVKPSSSTTGRIQRGGRPVATTNRAPASTAARTASRVRGGMVSFSSNKVPSTSQATSAGILGWVTETSLSMSTALVLSRPRHPVGPVLLYPLLQLGQPDRSRVFLGRRDAAEPPRHPVLSLGVRVVLLDPIQQHVHRIA